MRGVRFLAALCCLFTLILAACGGSTPPANAPTAAPAATTAPAATAAPAEPTQAPTAAEAAAPTAAEAAAPTAAPAAPAGERTKITYWYNPPDTGTSCVVDNVITPFNATSTSLEVDAVSTPNAWDATRTAIAGGAGPDVVVTPGPSFVFELAKA